MSGRTICLMNDAYPPIIDGVANVVVNYASNIEKSGGHVIVAAPEYPGADDSGSAWPVIRFPSLDTRKSAAGYVAGIPFSPEIAGTLQREKAELIHVHCPMMSSILAREIRRQIDVPLVMTYHTKYDIDIANVIRSKTLQKSAIHAIVSNINAFDEVWAVSRGAGENLRSLGYEGDYIVMPNGVDLPAGRASDEAVQAAAGAYDLPENLPVFLFVGRLMWYKGLKIILDALKTLQNEQKDFRMVFVGGGADGDAVKQYTKELGLDSKTFFTGPIYDREVLRAWYTRASLFLFPSTFDTNGLVVREAAACSLGAVLIKGSCAAEDVTDNRNALLIDENAESMASLLRKIINNPAFMREIGDHAREDLYLSWTDAVAIAAERYEVVLDRYKSGDYEKHRKLSDALLSSQGDVMETLSAMIQLKQESDARRQALFDELEADYDNAREEFRSDASAVRNGIASDFHDMRGDIHDMKHELSSELHDAANEFSKGVRGMTDEISEGIRGMTDEIRTELHGMKYNAQLNLSELRDDVQLKHDEIHDDLKARRDKIHAERQQKKTETEKKVDASFDRLAQIMEEWDRYL